MRKIIDVPSTSIPKLKLIAALEGKSVKKCMEEAVEEYILSKQEKRLSTIDSDKKEDLGLLLLIQQAETNQWKTTKEIL